MNLLGGTMEDGLPIDNEELKEVIVAFNVNGIPTIASNAGHAVQQRGTGDTPYPWILISSENQKEDIASIYSRTEAFLTEFYKNRPTEEYIKLRAQDMEGDQFIVSNVSKEIDMRLVNKELTESEKEDLIVKLSQRQQELWDFGQFLKSKFFKE